MKVKVTIKATPEIVMLAKEALAVQDACNMCGIAQTFAQVMIALNNQSTFRVCQHPITKLWIDKFQSLARLPQDFDATTESYEACKSLSEGNDVELEMWAR